MSAGMHQHEDKLLEYAYGELSGAEASAIEAHVQGCERCGQALSNIRGVRTTMGRLTAEPAPEAGLDSLLAYAQQAARRSAAGPAPASSFWRRWLAPLAGATALLAIGIVAYEVNQKTELKVDKVIAQQAKLEAPSKRQEVAAADNEVAALEAPEAVAPAAPPPAARPPAAPQPAAAPIGGAAAGKKELAMKAPLEKRAPSKKAKVDYGFQSDSYKSKGSSLGLSGFGSSEGSGRFDRQKPTSASPAPAPELEKDQVAERKADAQASKQERKDMEDEAALQEAAPRSEPAAAATSTPAPQRSRAAAPSSDAQGDGIGGFSRSIVLAQQQLRSGVTGEARANALERLCEAYFALGNEPQATDYCQRLLKEFPQSPSAKLAKQRLEELRETKKANSAATEAAKPAD